MIKFWKSAAKGKSGCPVRPPEQCSVSGSKIKYLLDAHLLDENEDQSQLFEKKSKLSLSLHDILIERKALNNFIQFMETLGKHLFIKCWLEIENFKSLISSSSYVKDIHSKLSRAKSYDLQSKDHGSQHEEFLTQNSLTDNKNHSPRTSNFKHNRSDSSTSLSSNLVECTNSIGNYDSKKHINLAEYAVNLFKKYVALEAPFQLDFPDSVRKNVISNICQPEGQIKEDCFKAVQEFIFNEIQNNYFNDFLNSTFYRKAQIDILTSGTINLRDILYNETILFYFTEYLEQESCSILLEFLMAIMHFRDNLINGGNSKPEQAQADAIVLYEKYFSLQATNPVGFSTDVRLKVESDICREEGPLPTCFDIPYSIVFKTLSCYVKAFLESELYYKYLTEMIHSVDQSTKHKSHSDCSSEFSISTQNTLLAMGDPAFRKKKRNHSVPDMTIDSNQLYNADSLWQRKRNDGLSLGRVNSLGRFESKFEPDPDKRDKSVLKRMVSRFVPSNTSKVEEEMAWQVAHMIVKDVTDLTMAPPDNDRDDL